MQMEGLMKWYVCTHLVSSHKYKTVPEEKRAGVFCLRLRDPGTDQYHGNTTEPK